MTALPRPPMTALSANVICSVSMLFWAAGLPAADVLIPLVEPLPLSAMRMALAGVVLIPFWAMLEGVGVLRSAPWARGIAVGAMIGIGALLLVIGQGLTDAVTVAVIGASMPVIGMTLEVLLDGRKLTAALVLGVILSLAGGVVTLLGKMGDIGIGLGALMCFGSVLSFTLGSRLTVTQFPALSPIGRTTVTLMGAAIATVGATALWAATGGKLPDPATLGGKEYGALFLFAVVGFSVSQVMWIMAVGRLGIGLSSLHMNLAPFYVMLILLGFGGTWDWMQALGAAIVGVGVLIAQGVIPVGRRA